MFSTCTTATNYRFLFFFKKIFIFLRFYNFIGYPMKSKGYRFYCPNHSTKIIKTDNARFIENGEISGSDQLQETNIQEVGVQVPLPITFKEIAAPTIVESFDNVEQQINDQSLPNEITTNEPIMEETQQSTLRRSQRERNLLFLMIMCSIYMNLIMILRQVKTRYHFHKQLAVMIMINGLMP